MVDDDRELLTAWSNGDKTAGQTLVRRHVGAVYGFFRNKLAGDVDDIVQRTFLGCIEALPRFRSESSFRTFLFAVARNTLLMALRQRYRTAQVIDAANESTFELGTTGEPTLPTDIEGYREQILLLRALRRLPIDDQIALELSYWENLPGKDIAEVLQRPHATVRTQLRRARLRLDALIAQLGEDARLVTSTTDAFDVWVANVREAMAAS